MKKVVNLRQISGYKKFGEILTARFVIDWLYPVFGERSVETLFHGWIGKEMKSWHRFTNETGDILEFYPEGTYVAKVTSTGQIYQRKNPVTVEEFIRDMENFGIVLYWTDQAEDISFS